MEKRALSPYSRLNRVGAGEVHTKEPVLRLNEGRALICLIRSSDSAAEFHMAVMGFVPLKISLKISMYACDTLNLMQSSAQAFSHERAALSRYFPWLS